MNSEAEQNAWREIRQKEKFENAFRGLSIFFATTRNLRIHIGAAVLAIILGIYFGVSSMEWIALVFAVGFVLVSEAFNTAIEIDIDLTSPEYHPYARDTKDVAAAAVLISAMTALIVGLIIFLPKLSIIHNLLNRLLV